MDIAVWLRELGPKRYEQAFRENEVEAGLLPKLTADDLTEVRVIAVGHRRKLLDAIAALAQSALPPQVEPSASAEAGLIEPIRAGEGGLTEVDKAAPMSHNRTAVIARCGASSESAPGRLWSEPHAFVQRHSERPP